VLGAVRNDPAVRDALTTVIDAYGDLSAGDPAPLIELLDDEVVWSTPGAAPEIGRERVARRLNAVAGTRIELVAVRRGESVVVFEFSRPWWKAKTRKVSFFRPLFDLRGEQAVWVVAGRIAKIESRERSANT
jgi:hypothetical protein